MENNFDLFEILLAFALGFSICTFISVGLILDLENKINKCVIGQEYDIPLAIQIAQNLNSESKEIGSIYDCSNKSQAYIQRMKWQGWDDDDVDYIVGWKLRDGEWHCHAWAGYYQHIDVNSNTFINPVDFGTKYRLDNSTCDVSMIEVC